MSVRPVEMADGSVRWRVTADVSPDPNKRKQKTMTFGDEAEANAVDQQYRDELRRRRADYRRLHGDRNGDGGMTVNDIIDNYLDSPLLTCTDRTRASYRGYLSHIRDRIGFRPAHTITADDIKHIIEQMTTCGRRRGGTPGTALSHRSAMASITRLRAAYELAVFEGKITRRVIPIDPEPGVIVLDPPADTRE